MDDGNGLFVGKTKCITMENCGFRHQELQESQMESESTLIMETESSTAPVQPSWHLVVPIHWKSLYHIIPRPITLATFLLRLCT